MFFASEAFFFMQTAATQVNSEYICVKYILIVKKSPCR